MIKQKARSNKQLFCELVTLITAIMITLIILREIRVRENQADHYIKFK